MLGKIVSGGQTGVDLAALDTAVEHKIEIGGWCPQGYINEEGVIPLNYHADLKEIAGKFDLEQENYDARTKANIRDSDGTLIIVPELPISKRIQDGTRLTVQEVSSVSKPYFILELSKEDAISECIDWINDNSINTLNVAGPRESSSPGIYEKSCSILDDLFQQLSNQPKYSF